MVPSRCTSLLLWAGGARATRMQMEAASLEVEYVKNAFKETGVYIRMIEEKAMTMHWELTQRWRPTTEDKWCRVGEDNGYHGGVAATSFVDSETGFAEGKDRERTHLALYNLSGPPFGLILDPKRVKLVIAALSDMDSGAVNSDSENRFGLRDVLRQKPSSTLEYPAEGIAGDDEMGIVDDEVRAYRNRVLLEKGGYRNRGGDEGEIAYVSNSVHTGIADWAKKAQSNPALIFDHFQDALKNSEIWEPRCWWDPVAGSLRLDAKEDGADLRTWYGGEFFFSEAEFRAKLHSESGSNRYPRRKTFEIEYNSKEDYRDLEIDDFRWWQWNEATIIPESETATLRDAFLGVYVTREFCSVLRRGKNAWKNDVEWMFHVVDLVWMIAGLDTKADGFGKCGGRGADVVLQPGDWKELGDVHIFTENVESSSLEEGRHTGTCTVTGLEGNA